MASGLTERWRVVTDIEVITGVEIRADLCDTKIEILGYYIDPTNEDLLALLEQAREYRRLRNDEMLGLLNDTIGLELSRETITSDGDALGRPHMVTALVENDVVPSVQAAFDKYLADDALWFVP